MAIQTRTERDRARLAGQVDLGAWIESAGWHLWSVQREICSSISIPRSTTTVPSCNSSGKTYLASRVGWAFLDSFRPGTPCRWCGGPCGGAKVITTSSTKDHLDQVLWTEIRVARRTLRGTMYDDLPECYPAAAETRVADDLEEWFMVGLNPDTAEGITGMHAPHKLIIGDEATALKTETADGINSLLASGDARMLLIYNPTTADVWVEQIAQDPTIERIRIRAWDTPHFTGEEAPPGATLITPDWLSDLRSRGMGPGTEIWERRVEARPWGLGERMLIPYSWWDRARKKQLKPAGAKVLGVDLARYGDAENTIARRWGPVLQSIKGWPAMDQRIFWRGPVLEEIRAFRPHIVTYDADGLGAGLGESVYQLEETLRRERISCEIIPFRGGGGAGDKYVNTRSMHWWRYRTLYEQNKIRIDFDDSTAREQTCQIQYGFTDKGAIKVESKENMRKRKLPSPDRGDAGMYAFAYDAPDVVVDETVYAMHDRSDEAMWKRQNADWDREERELDEFGRRVVHVVDPVDGTTDDW